MPEPRPEVLHTPLDSHGGPDGKDENLLDFSVNSNPFGPPVELLAHLRQVDLATYPDPTARRARDALALHHESRVEAVVLGNGAAELIHRLAACYLTPGRRVVIAGPTFGEYGRASALYGADVVRVDAYPHREHPDEAPLLAAIARVRPTLVWACHPNNPTGHAWTGEQLSALSRACRQNDALLVLDAAYHEMAELDAAALPADALSLWSLTKNFCIPGLRIGYALGPPLVVQYLERSAAPWQASSHAQIAAVWGRSDAGAAFLARTLPELKELRFALQGQVEEAGYSVRARHAPFLLAEVGDAAGFTRRARNAGFRVRDASSFGLPSVVRLAPKRAEANLRLVAWMRRQRYA